MFHSTHVFTGETIYRRPAQSYTEFTDELNRLQTLQQTFAQSSITERTALLQQFADSLTQNQERLAEMVCEEVGRCLHECRAEISNPSSLSATTSALPPSCLPIKPSPPKPVSAKSASSLWALFGGHAVELSCLADFTICHPCPLCRQCLRGQTCAQCRPRQRNTLQPRPQRFAAYRRMVKP